MKRFAFGLALLAAGVAHADPHFDALVKAERDFAADAPVIGIAQAFGKHMAPDSVVFRPLPVEGRVAFANSASAPPSPITLEWGPSHAEIAASGDMGYTFGPAVYKAKPGATGPDGKPLPAEPWFTDFFSIWVRNEAGQFFNVLDQGVSDPKTALTDDVVRLGSATPANDATRLPVAETSARLQQLLWADRKLAGALATADADKAFRDMLSADAYLLRDGVGVRKASESTAPQATVPLMQLSAIRMSAAGDLGATAGFGGDEKSPQTYQRAWRWIDGQWKVVVDLTSAPRQPRK